MRDRLDSIFSPRSVAVIGASKDPTKWGNLVAKSLIDSSYPGKIYLVNPRGGTVYGRETYASIHDIPDSVDLAVVGIPVKFVADSIKDCIRKGVKGIVVVTAHFGEYSDEGRRIEKEIVEMAHEAGTRIVGPNCLGIYNSAIDLNTVWTSFLRGPIAIITQSGNVGLEVNYVAKRRGIGFSKFISFGNQIDIRLDEYLDYVTDDPDSKVIFLYIEGIKDGKEFLRAAKMAMLNKPVLAIKAGTGSAGVRACASHTGSLASSSEVCQAAFRQCGIIIAETGVDLLDIGEAFVKCPLPAGNRIGILTNGGGFGTLAADISEKYKLEIPMLSEGTKQKLIKAVPPEALHCGNNPVDFADEADWWAWARLPEIMLEDKDIDGLVIVGGFGGYEDTWPASKEIWPQTADIISKLPKKYNKPIVVHSLFEEDKPKSLEIFRRQGIPVYGRIEVAIRCMSSLVERSRYLEKVQDDAREPIPKLDSRAASTVKAIIASSREKGCLNLLETEAREILAAYGIPVPVYKLAKTQEDAIDFASKIGYPVAMKIVSPDIVHKTEAGGVRLNLKDNSDVAKSFSEIIASAKAYDSKAEISGVIITPMEGTGREVIIGMTKDPTFGATIMFGLGGTFVEALKDVAFRIAPLTSRDAREMVQEIRGYRVLTGIRGQKAVSIDAIVNIILRISALVMDHPKISELDLNPVFTFEDHASIVDARILVTK